MVARIVRNRMEGKNVFCLAMLADAKAGTRPQRLTFSCTYQEAWLDVNSLNKVRWDKKIEIKADQSRL